MLSFFPPHLPFSNSQRSIDTVSPHIHSFPLQLQLQRGRSDGPSGPTDMAQNTSGSAPSVNTNSREKSPIPKISEDEEFEVTSPTDMTFRQANNAGATSV